MTSCDRRPTCRPNRCASRWGGIAHQYWCRWDTGDGGSPSRPVSDLRDPPFRTSWGGASGRSPGGGGRQAKAGVEAFNAGHYRRPAASSVSAAPVVSLHIGGCAVANWRPMALLAGDWATISSLATAAGTLVLAVATFSSVRSSNRSARIAEAALQEQRRPVLAPSRLDDATQKIMFLEEHWVSAPGGRAAVEHIDGIVYL